MPEVIVDRLFDLKKPVAYAVSRDSEFVMRACKIRGKNIGFCKERKTYDVHKTSLVASADHILQKNIPGLQQSHEWDFREVRTLFGCLRLPLPVGEILCFRVIDVCSHLSNIGVLIVEINHHWKICRKVHQNQHL